MSVDRPKKKRESVKNMSKIMKKFMNEKLAAKSKKKPRIMSAH